MFLLPNLATPWRGDHGERQAQLHGPHPPNGETKAVSGLKGERREGEERKGLGVRGCPFGGGGWGWDWKQIPGSLQSSSPSSPPTAQAGQTSPAPARESNLYLGGSRGLGGRSPPVPLSRHQQHQHHRGRGHVPEARLLVDVRLRFICHANHPSILSGSLLSSSGHRPGQSQEMDQSKQAIQEGASPLKPITEQSCAPWWRLANRFLCPVGGLPSGEVSALLSAFVRPWVSARWVLLWSGGFFLCRRL